MIKVKTALSTFGGKLGHLFVLKSGHIVTSDLNGFDTKFLLSKREEGSNRAKDQSWE